MEVNEQPPEYDQQTSEQNSESVYATAEKINKHSNKAGVQVANSHIRL